MSDFNEAVVLIAKCGERHKTCGSSMVRKFMGRRHDRLDVYAPKGQESVYA